MGVAGLNETTPVCINCGCRVCVCECVCVYSSVLLSVCVCAVTVLAVVKDFAAGFMLSDSSSIQHKFSCYLRMF